MHHLELLESNVIFTNKLFMQTQYKLNVAFRQQLEKFQFQTTKTKQSVANVSVTLELQEGFSWLHNVTTSHRQT